MNISPWKDLLEMTGHYFSRVHHSLLKNALGIKYLFLVFVGSDLFVNNLNLLINYLRTVKMAEYGLQSLSIARIWMTNVLGMKLNQNIGNGLNY